MRIVRCSDCGRHYNYDDDGFCPKCGTFNQPPKDSAVNAEGEIVRVDGLNEAGHEDSFVHQEFHREQRERHRNSLMGEKISRSGKEPEADSGEAALRGTRRKSRGPALAFSVIIWIFVIYMLIRTILGVL